MFYVLPALSAVVDTCEDTGITVNSDRSLIAVNYESGGLAIDDDCSLTAGEGAIISIGTSHLLALALTIGIHKEAVGRAEGDTRRYIHRAFLERALPSGAVQRIVAAGLRVAADKGQRYVTGGHVVGGHSATADGEGDVKLTAFDGEVHGATAVAIGVGSLVVFRMTWRLNIDRNIGCGGETDSDFSFSVVECPLGTYQRGLCVGATAATIAVVVLVAGSKAKYHRCYEADLK